MVLLHHHLTGHPVAHEDEAAWGAYRRHHLGASEVAAALGLCPYAGARPWDVLARKIEGIEPVRSPAESRRLRQGLRWEHRVLEDYEEETGHRVLVGLPVAGTTTLTLAPLESGTRTWLTVEHPTESWLAASPDAFVAVRGLGLGLAEAKTSGEPDIWAESGTVIEVWGDGCDALLPVWYAIQGFVQMACCGLPFVDFVVGIARPGAWPEVGWIRLMAQPEAQARIVDDARSWWERHVIRGESLPLDDSDGCHDALVRRYGRGGGSMREASMTESALILQYAEAGRAVRMAEAHKRGLRNQILAAVGNDRGLFLPGQPRRRVVVNRQPGAEILNTAALRAEQPTMAARYTTRGEPVVSLIPNNLARLETP
jgi:predicted phage-related endonuclease